MHDYHLQFFCEFEIERHLHNQINALLSNVFNDIDYEGKSFHKQMPNYRLIGFYNDKIIGHLGIDFRAMSINQNAINVLGVKALCVHPEYRQQGVGKQLMLEFERIAKEYKNNIDFLFLVTDIPKYYEKFGYETIKPKITWLKIDEFKTLGVGNEHINDASFMVKPVSSKKWPKGDLDMLGYIY